MLKHRNNAEQTLTLARDNTPEVTLPAYVRAVMSRSTGRSSYYFEVPTWARREDCPVASCALGSDRDAALAQGVRKGEELHEWMGGRHSVQVASGPVPGSLGALIEIYKGHRNYLSLRDASRRTYDADLRTLAAHEMRSGSWSGIPLGRLPWQRVTAQLVDALIDDLLVRIVQVDGQLVVIRTPRRARSIISTAATMWNVALIAGGLDTTLRPFAGHRIKRDVRETTAASADQLCDVVRQADALGNPMLGTIVLAIYELVWRPEHVVRNFQVEHYRPSHRPDEVLITDAKNGCQRWRPLFDHAGQPQYPALSARLDAVKGERTTGYMFAREGAADGAPPSMVTVRTWLREVVGTTPHHDLTPTCFRHGGLTECGEAGLNEFEIRRLSQHKNPAVLGRYVHGTSVGQELSQAKRVDLRKGRRGSTRGTRFLTGAD